MHPRRPGTHRAGGAQAAPQQGAVPWAMAPAGRSEKENFFLPFLSSITLGRDGHGYLGRSGWNGTWKQWAEDGEGRERAAAPGSSILFMGKLFSYADTLMCLLMSSAAWQQWTVNS